MSFIKKYGIILVILLFGPASYLIYQAQIKPEDKGTSASEKVTKNLDTDPLSIHRQRNIGDQVQFEIDWSSHGDFDFTPLVSPGQSGLRHQIEVELRSTIHQTLTKIEENHFHYLMSFLEPKVRMKINQQASLELAEQIRLDLQRSMVAVFDHDMQLIDVHYPTETSINGREVIFALIKSWQFVAPEGDHTQSWRSFEHDSTGRFDAEYYIEKTGSELIRQITKVRGQYQEVNFVLRADEISPQLSIHPRGSIHFLYNRDKDLILSAEGEESLQYIDISGRFLGENTLRLKLASGRLISLSKQDIQETQAFAEQRFQTGFSYIESQKLAAYERLKQIHEQHWGSSSLSELITEFASRNDLSEQEQMQLFLKLRAFTFLFPEQLAALEQELLMLSHESAFLYPALSALVNISSPEAQQVLVNLAEQRQDDLDYLLAVLPALGFVRSPELATELSLRAISQESRNQEAAETAELALGNLARQLKIEKTSKQDAQERFNDIAGELVQRLESSQDADDINHILRILANAAVDQAISSVEGYTRHENPRVRAYAVLALRFLAFEQVEDILKRMDQDEDDEDARQALVESMSFMPATQDKLQMEIAMLRRGGTASYKIQLLGSIAKARYLDQDQVLSTIESVSRYETEQAVLQYALGLLMQLKSDS